MNMTKKNSNTREMVMAALCLALALLLPFLTGQIKEIGNMLCPMHIPVLLCAFLCNWKWSGTVGLTAPLLRSSIWGMPPMGPIAIGMTFELAAYGIIASVAYRRLPKKTWSIYAALIIAMIGGRIVWGVVSMFLYGAMNTPFTWQMFMAGAFINAIPGIIIQIVLIPVIVIALERAGVSKK